MSLMSNKKLAIISACLAGINCRYNGNHCLTEYLNVYKDKYILIPVCPEQLGGLPTPRLKCEIKDGDGFEILDGKTFIYNEHNENVTEKFLNGANEVLKICQLLGINIAFFKEKSPSCGVRKIYNNKTLVNGCGITTALLLRNNIQVFGVE